jgi:phosphoglycolate phosphatase
MTDVPVDDPDVLRHILANTEALLLDFDGPICSVFAGFPADVVANQLRWTLSEKSYESLPEDVATTADPFEILRYASSLGNAEERFIEAALRAQELEAVATAVPTEGSHTIMRVWHASGRKLAIVSNNSVIAIESYLSLHKLTKTTDGIFGRTGHKPQLLKPNPYLLNQACESLGIDPAACTFIGDAPTDIQAARAAKTVSIGYANKPGKFAKLQGEQPDIVITRLSEAIRAIQSEV